MLLLLKKHVVIIVKPCCY